MEVQALNADPTPIEEVTVPQIIEHLESVVGGLEKPPILIGHSAGGVFTQMRSTFPVLKNPANRHRAVGFTPEQWHYAFTNTFSEEESLALYERYHIPASGNIFWGTALANVTPGHQGNWVNYHNDDRAPPLFISGTEDHLMPPSIQRSNLKHYKANTVTEIKEFDGPHLLPQRTGGNWSPTSRWTGRSPTPPARRPGNTRKPLCRRDHPTPGRHDDGRHHAHRRADRADRDRRVAAAHRPDVRLPRPQVHLRLGVGVPEAARGGRCCPAPVPC